MSHPKKLLASVAIAAGLLAGGVTGVVLGVPGVSGAQTTTVPGSPGTTAPDTGQTNPDRNCPDKAGAGTPAPATGATGTNLSFHRGGGGV